MIVVREDDKKGIKVAPKLSNAHFQSESFAAMSVKLAFSVSPLAIKMAIFFCT